MIALKSSLYIIALLASFLAYTIIATFEGFFRAWAAKKMGDSTAQQEGYLSLNPLIHIDIVGAMFLLLLGFGWGKIIPIDHRNISNRFKLICAYLAGPLACIVMTIGALVFLLKIFGFKILYVAQASSIPFLGLSQLSAVYPGYSSSLLALGLIVVKMIFFGPLLAAFHAVSQSLRFFLLMFFPELLYKPEVGLLVFLVPLLLAPLFIGPLRAFIWSIVFFFDTLLGYILGAS